LVKTVACGLKNLPALPGLLKGRYDIFYHLGWSHTDKIGRLDPPRQAANIGYTLEAVDAAAKLGCRTFLGAGSQSEYGPAAGAINEKTPAAPEFAYAIAKYAAGRLSAIRCRELGLKHVWTRIFSVYGPFNRPDNMILSCVDRLLRRQKPAMTKCEQIWDYLYCSDAARALYLAAARGKDQAVYNVGSGRGRRLKDYVNEIRDEAGPGMKIGFGKKPYPRGQVMFLRADISRLTKDTSFQPKVSFKEGIRRTVEWYREVNK
jgi:nucleoside-diphosphate-sugar epimerase